MKTRMSRSKACLSISGHILKETWRIIRKWVLPSPSTVLFTVLAIGALFLAQSVGALRASRSSSSSTSVGTIAYQGRLTDADGDPLTGTYSMVYRLYDVYTGGAPLWTEQWTGSNRVAVSGGLFNVLLGSLTPIPQGVIASSGPLYLGVTIATDDEMRPRVQIGSVPYAMQALTVPDGSITTEKISDGGVTAPKLHIVGDYAFVDNLGTMNNTSWQSFTTPLRATITLDDPCHAIVSYTLLARGGGGTVKRALTQVFIDEVDLDIETLGYVARAGYGTIARTFVHALNPGQHTIEVKARTENGHTAQYQRGTLTVFCLPMSAS